MASFRTLLIGFAVSFSSATALAQDFHPRETYRGGDGSFRGNETYRRGRADFGGRETYRHDRPTYRGRSPIIVRREPVIVRRPVIVHRPVVYHDRYHRSWRQGRWQYAMHNNQLAWWWIAGGVWHMFNKPVYPYPSEPQVIERTTTVIVPTPTSSATVPAPTVTYGEQPESAALPPPKIATAENNANYFYCESSNSYYPYVKTCSESWQQLPSTPR